MSMKIKYWNVTLIVCILPVYLYHVWSFKLPHTLRDYHSTLNHAVQRVFIQYKCCLVDVSQWMIHNKTLLTYHRRWKQNDNSRLQVHLCCRLRESSPSIKFVIHCIPIYFIVCIKREFHMIFRFSWNHWMMRRISSFWQRVDWLPKT